MRATEFEIRRASPDESGVLTEIAHAAKRHWGYPEAWIREWRDALTITPELIRDQHVYVALHAGEIAGFYGLIGGGAELALEHLWVLPVRIGQGVGRALFERSLEMAATLGADRVAIEADPNAEGFYLHLGAERIGCVARTVAGVERVLPKLVIAIKS